MRIHEVIKPHSCKICGKCFTQANCVVRHMRIHSGETPYPCTLCYRRFSYSHHLVKHMKKEHINHVSESDKESVIKEREQQMQW
jgi:uncharacterized Zn-finger protein